MSKLLDIISKAQKLATDCAPHAQQNNFAVALRGDMATCIADLAALLPKLAHAIQAASLTEIIGLVPDFQKAFTDCSMSTVALKTVEKIQKLRDMPHCIQDLVVLIPEVMDAIKNKDMSKIMDIFQKAQ